MGCRPVEEIVSVRSRTGQKWLSLAELLLWLANYHFLTSSAYAHIVCSGRAQVCARFTLFNHFYRFSMNHYAIHMHTPKDSELTARRNLIGWVDAGYTVQAPAPPCGAQHAPHRALWRRPDAQCAPERSGLDPLSGPASRC